MAVCAALTRKLVIPTDMVAIFPQERYTPKVQQEAGNYGGSLIAISFSLSNSSPLGPNLAGVGKYGPRFASWRSDLAPRTHRQAVRRFRSAVDKQAAPVHRRFRRSRRVRGSAQSLLRADARRPGVPSEDG